MKKLETSKFMPNFDLIVNLGNVLEEYCTASYVGQFPLKQKSRNGAVNFTDWFADVFYEPNPRKDLGHGHYFAIYSQDGRAFIIGADHVEDLILSVYTDLTGAYIYSRYQHDFRSFSASIIGDTANCQKMSIDGGWWMPDADSDRKFCMIGRTLWETGPCHKGMKVIVRDGEFFEVEDGDVL